MMAWINSPACGTLNYYAALACAGLAAVSGSPYIAGVWVVWALICRYVIWGKHEPPTDS